MPQSLRWGLLSTAHINEKIIAAVGRSERSSIVAVASRTQDSAQTYASRFGIQKSHGSYDALLADPDVDVIYVSVPCSMHPEWVVRAAESGKHVMCEKPLALNPQDVERIQNAAKKHRVTVFEAFAYMHHPQMATILELLASGRCGLIHHVSAHFHFLLSPDAAQGIRLNPELGGGALNDVGVYPTSFALTVLAPATPVRVWAHFFSGDAAVDLTFTAQLAFSNGAVAQISASMQSPIPGPTRIIGSQGCLAVPSPWFPDKSVLVYFGRDGKKETIVARQADPFVNEVAAMEACVLDKAEPVLSLERSGLFAATVQALAKSATRNEPVAL
jgi:D-xylose 1-dehydrogenase (NADP+, D-xylono-1,5-lactone-forming)